MFAKPAKAAHPKGEAKMAGVQYVGFESTQWIPTTLLVRGSTHSVAAWSAAWHHHCHESCHDASVITLLTGPSAYHLGGCSCAEKLSTYTEWYHSVRIRISLTRHLS